MTNATPAPAPVPTIAETIAASLGDNGTIWRTDDGVSLDQLAEAADAEVDRHPRKPDVCRWTFPDGSVITAAGEGWDFGFATCWCWAGEPQMFHPAPSGECDRDPRDVPADLSDCY